MKWIKCKDRLPDKDGLYLIAHERGGRWEMFFKTEDKKWYWQPNPYSVCGDGFIERWLDESAVPVKSEDSWLTEKPKFTEDCVLVVASKFKDHWEYHIYCIEKQFTDEGWYWGWLTGDGEEYGDIEDLTADKYLLIPKLK